MDLKVRTGDMTSVSKDLSNAMETPAWRWTVHAEKFERNSGSLVDSSAALRWIRAQ